MIAKNLTLTIFIPVYNEERYLKACLDAIKKQTIQPNEVIVVDNNSTDKTEKIAKTYSFVRLLSEGRQGVLFADQKGFNAAKSDIIGRIDGDTILPPDWVKNVLDLFKDKKVAAVTGPVNYYDMPFPKTNFRFDHFMRNMTYKLAKKNPFLYGSNMAVRKKSWNMIANELCRDQNIHGDIDMAIHLTKHNQRILYARKLLASTSGRRYNDSLKNFTSYVGMHRRVYKKHRLPLFAPYIAVFMWSLGYVILHPWRNIWYKLHSRLNRDKPYTKEARKNPMAG